MLYSFTMVNSAKTILTKKNRLTCDHTTGEVLTTFNINYNIHIEPISIIYETHNTRKRKCQ